MTADVNSLDTLKLAAYLEARIDGFQGALTAEKFVGGQSNPTLFLKARKCWATVICFLENRKCTTKPP